MPKGFWEKRWHDRFFRKGSATVTVIEAGLFVCKKDC